MTKRSRAIRRLGFFVAVLVATFALQGAERLVFHWFEGGAAGIASMLVGFVYLITLVCAAWWIYPRTGPGSHYYDDAAKPARRSSRRPKKSTAAETPTPRRSSSR